MKLVTRLTIFCFACAALASVLLYNTSYKVQALKTTQRALDADIVAEQNAIRVLQAEWAYLAEPTRIEKLAAKHLAMKTIESAKQGVRIQTAATFARGEQPKAVTPTKVATKTDSKVSVAVVKPAAASSAAAGATTATPASASSNTPTDVQLLLASFKQQ